MARSILHGNKLVNTHGGYESFDEPPLEMWNLIKGLIYESDPTSVISKINKDLKSNYDYTDMERDALRHYLGMQQLADIYGPVNAKFIGDMHEYGQPGGAEQSEIDIRNNIKAIEDYKANMRLKEYDKSILDSLLKELEVPPTPEHLKKLKDDIGSF